jgi:hypothetical protein
VSIHNLLLLYYSIYIKNIYKKIIKKQKITKNYNILKKYPHEVGVPQKQTTNKLVAYPCGCPQENDHRQKNFRALSVRL